MPFSKGENKEDAFFKGGTKKLFFSKREAIKVSL